MNEQQEYKNCIKSCKEKYEADPQNCTEAVIDCDFQMVKLLPHWRVSPQPGKTYYYGKLKHDLFGIIDHRTGKNYIYVTEETIGDSKDSNHVLSHLQHFVDNFLSPNVQTLRLNLDSAAYFKCYYIVAWAAERIALKRFQKVVIVCMVPGNTKFGPD